MVNIGIKSLFYNMRLSWLTGPLFDKELRVSSRRKRNYFVRFVYLLILIFFVVSMWLRIYIYKGPSSAVYQVSQMAKLGISITSVIVWFQFIVIQIIAVIMLSTSIGNEIYHKTLGVLMTTPINSFQIVFSKLLSKLLQLILLLAISLPLLSIIRVFGGVPWEYVLLSIFITLTSAIFAGSLSLLFSIYNRHSHIVITRTIFTCFLIYAGPLIAFAILRNYGYTNISKLIPEIGLFFINPFMHMNDLTSNLFNPSAINNKSLLLHCAVMLGLSAAILIWAGFCVRKAGLRQVTGQAGMLLTRKERRLAKKKQRAINYSKRDSGKIREVKGSPIIWKELSNPLSKSNILSIVLSILIVAGLMALAYSLCLHYHMLFQDSIQIAFILVYLFVALLRTSTFSSTCITSEKEARTWPILLTSPLSAKKIVFEKIIGSCIRAWPFWFILYAHILVFILHGTLRPVIIFPLTVIFLSSTLLVSSAGVLFSSVFKRSSTSATVNIIGFIVFTVPVPVCCIFPLYLGSPLIAAFSVIAHYAGFHDVTNSFFGPSLFAPYGLVLNLLFSYFSFIIYSLFYLFLTFIAYLISIGHIRWRII